MELSGKRVLVVGSGKSGVSAAALLLRAGARPAVLDENEKADTQAIRSRLPEGAELFIGKLPKDVAQETALVVVSPGVPVDALLPERFRERGIPVWGELELAYRQEKGTLAAITGTNGKTTTTALVGQILADHFGQEKTFVVGNIGNPYTAEAEKTTPDTVTAAEVSSFQLETAVTFKPRVSAILNITPDHLDRHHTMETYVAVKESIAKNQSGAEACVLNFEDPHTRRFGERCPARVIWFSSGRVLPDGYFCSEDVIYAAKEGRAEPLLNIHEMHLLGTHNVENVMAAIAVTEELGVPRASVLETVRNFQAVEHRIEYVATKRGVDYYNDSKGTNPDAAIQGIKAMGRPTVLIGGGYDKHSEFDSWIESFGGKVTWLVLLGQTKEKIAACARKHGFTNIILTDSLEEAVRVCEEKARPGDAVLLSPACASWGMFPNYEVRGCRFKELVTAIKE